MNCHDCDYFSNLYPLENIGYCSCSSNGVDDPFVLASNTDCKVKRALDLVVTNENGSGGGKTNEQKDV